MIGPNAFNFQLVHDIQHPPSRQEVPWFIDIALKLGAQLGISNSKSFLIMTRLLLELTTSNYGGERSTFTLPVHCHYHNCAKKFGSITNYIIEKYFIKFVMV